MPKSGSHSQKLRVIQVLPALDAGGVERGTVEFANAMVAQGHESYVISNGGRMVAQLEQQGSVHISLPVHRKSLISLRLVPKLHQLLIDLKPDIVHVRSRAPAWLIWLAWRKLPAASRPHLVSTVHGMYSVNAYSAIMTKAEHVIAISDCVHDYITKNYHTPEARITRIYRGLDPSIFSNHDDNATLEAQLLSEFPQFQNKKLIVMPGRLSRWKGQEAFLQVMAKLTEKRSDVHGVIIGAAEDNKQHYLDELKQQCHQLGLDSTITFTGHRSDIQDFYRLAAATCHLSNKAEPFGRTVPEALACGSPVVAFDRGGASESLHQAYPVGLVEADNITVFAERLDTIMDAPRPEITLPAEFYLDAQVNATLDVYYRLLGLKAD